jgi:hypothetical protein
VAKHTSLEAQAILDSFPSALGFFGTVSTVQLAPLFNVLATSVPAAKQIVFDGHEIATTSPLAAGRVSKFQVSPPLRLAMICVVPVVAKHLFVEAQATS